MTRLWLLGGCWWSAQSSAAAAVGTLIEMVEIDRRPSQRTDGTFWKMMVGGESGSGERATIDARGPYIAAFVGRVFGSGIDPRTLIEDNRFPDGSWGRYAVVAIDERARRVALLRDPTGLRTLYYVVLEDGLLFGTELGLVSQVLPPRHRINWPYVASFIVHGPTVTADTALRDIEEVEPGRPVVVTATARRKTAVWSPANIAQSPVAMADVQAADCVRTTLLDVVKRWAEGSSSVSIDVSGGIDSAALLATYASIGAIPVVGTCVHHPGVAVADELRFARLVAEQHGVQLLELDGELALPCSPDRGGRRLWDRPIGQLLQLRLHELHVERRVDTTTQFVNGFGGDQVFMARFGDVLHLVDHWCEDGLDAWTEVVIAAKSSGRSIPAVLWRTAGTAARHGLLRRYDGGLWTGNPPAWCTDELRRLLSPDFLRPYFWRDLRLLSPAKARQALEVYEAAAWVDRNIRTDENLMLHPYLSQPLVELGLRLPTTVLFRQAMDRRPLRMAMQNLLPTEIVHRSDKGDYFAIYQLGLRRHLTELEATVTDGVLVRAGLVSANGFLEDLLLAAHGQTIDLWPILNVLAVERWFHDHRIG